MFHIIRNISLFLQADGVLRTHISVSSEPLLDKHVSGKAERLTLCCCRRDESRPFVEAERRIWGSWVNVIIEQLA